MWLVGDGEAHLPSASEQTKQLLTVLGGRLEIANRIRSLHVWILPSLSDLCYRLKTRSYMEHVFDVIGHQAVFHACGLHDKFVQPLMIVGNMS